MASQAEAQVNGLSSIVEGVNKRQPTRHVAQIMAGSAGDVYIHTINRDVSERYIVAVFNGSIKVFDLAGNEKTVSYPSGTGYITTATPSSSIRAITLADYTFIVNTDKVIEKDSTYTAPTATGAGFAFIRAVQYDTTYKIEIDGVEQASYTTADAYGVDPKVSIQEVVDALAATLTANLGAGWTVTAHSPIIHIQNDSGTDFTLKMTDSNGNTMSRAVYDRVQRFTDLPTVGKHGTTVHVTGVDGEDGDDYYLKFEADAGTGFDAGIWTETVAPGTQTRLDASTMPHVLIRNVDGTFSLEEAQWGERTCGTEVTAPWPSFVGGTVSDIFYDRNRLCFLSDSNVIASRSRELFSFFRETTTTLLDSDPIDVVAAGSKVSKLQYAVPFDKQIVIFSEQTQFIISDEQLLASKPPALREITAYEIDKKAKPVAVGKTIYFAVKGNTHSRVMEYFIMPDTETTDAADVTKHVPRYIPIGVFKMAASSTDDIMITLNETKRNEAYVYKFYWQGSEKMQSSWSVWRFQNGAKLLNADFVGGRLYFVIEYSDGVYLETMDISGTIIETDGEFNVRLDRQLTELDVSRTYNAVTDTTEITLPYEQSVDGISVVSGYDVTAGAFPAYKKLKVVDNTPATKKIRVTGDHTTTKLVIGEGYEFLYQFSQPVVKSAGPGGGQASVLAGRLQLQRWHLAYARTGYFKATVATGRGQSYSYVYTGRTLGTASSVVNSFALADGEFNFRVNGNAKTTTVTITNDSFLPSYITAAEWEGRFERRTSRA
jgi:hypothetical protein